MKDKKEKLITEENDINTNTNTNNGKEDEININKENNETKDEEVIKEYKIVKELIDKGENELRKYG